MRTDRGPQNSWLARIGKSAATSSQCGHPAQNRSHIVFHCPRYHKERKDLLGARKAWEDLDEPNWRKEEGDDSHWDTIVSFFDFIFKEVS